MILILGSEDIHSVAIRDRIRARGCEAVIWDTSQFPLSTALSYMPGRAMSGTLIQPGGEILPLESITALYWYCFNGVGVTPSASSSDQYYFRTEAESALGSMLRGFSCTMVNPPEAVERHRFKPYQLSLIEHAGGRIPKTLVSNDPKAVRAFYDAMNGAILCKPLANTGLPQRLTADDITPEKLALLSGAPVQFQEVIEGIDVRVHGVGKRLLATQVTTETGQYKTDANVNITPISLGAEIDATCLRIMDALDHVLTGIDLRLTPEGEAVFFEANPSPLFLWYEEKSGLPISDAVVDLLLGPL